MLVSVYVVQYKEETRIQCLVVLRNLMLRITWWQMWKHVKVRLRQFDFCLREKEEKGRKITIADTITDRSCLKRKPAATQTEHNHL